MLRRLRFPLLLLLLFMFVTPAFAQTIDRVPEVRPVERSRFEIAITLNDQVAIVGRGETIVPNRQHYVLQQLNESGEVAAVQEVVIADGVLYSRENESETWQISLYSQPLNDPTIDFVAIVMELDSATLVGSTEIAGVPVDHYQVIGNTDPNGNPTDIFDLWIGKQANYLYQSQYTQIETLASGAQNRVAYVSRSYDFNDPSIQVSPPQGENVPPISGPIPWAARIGQLGSAAARQAIAAQLLQR